MGPRCGLVTVSAAHGLSVPLSLVSVVHTVLPGSAELANHQPSALAGVAERVTVVEIMSAGAGLLLASLVANGN